MLYEKLVDSALGLTKRHRRSAAAYTYAHVNFAYYGILPLILRMIFALLVRRECWTEAVDLVGHTTAA